MDFEVEVEGCTDWRYGEMAACACDLEKRRAVCKVPKALRDCFACIMLLRLSGEEYGNGKVWRSIVFKFWQLKSVKISSHSHIFLVRCRRGRQNVSANEEMTIVCRLYLSP